jgi:spermidine/putrescine transport system permease protein
MLIFIALGQFLSRWGYTIEFGFATVLIGHITFNLPYTVLSIMPKLRQINTSTYEAALDLGASRWLAFRKVILPDILPCVLSGFMLAFTLSLDDFVITHFTKGPGFDTISTKVYTEVRKGIKPEMYALSTLLFVSILLILLIFGRGPKKKAASEHLSRV